MSNEVSSLLYTEARSWSDALEDTGSLLDMTVEGPTYMSLTKRASKMLGRKLDSGTEIKSSRTQFIHVAIPKARR